MGEATELDDSKRKIANSFFGYYPRWQMFLKEISTVRDQTKPDEKKLEDFVKIALSELAYLVGISVDGMMGFYAGAQSSSNVSTFFRDELFKYYAQAFQDHYGVPLNLGPDN